MTVSTRIFNPLQHIYVIVLLTVEYKQQLAGCLGFMLFATNPNLNFGIQEGNWKLLSIHRISDGTTICHMSVKQMYLVH